MSAALVVVDLQVVFADPASDWAAPGFAGVVAPVRSLVEAFDAAGAPVVFTRFVAPAEPAGPWAEYYARWPFALRPASDPLWDLVDGVGRRGEHPVVDATTFGKWGQALASAVGGAGTLVLAGVSTDCCVLSTALAAADAGVAVQVVADACAGVSEADHERALAAMALYDPLVRVVDAASVHAALGAGSVFVETPDGDVLMSREQLHELVSAELAGPDLADQVVAERRTIAADEA